MHLLPQHIQARYVPSLAASSASLLVFIGIVYSAGATPGAAMGCEQAQGQAVLLQGPNTQGGLVWETFGLQKSEL